MPESEFDKAVAQLAKKGYSIIQELRLDPAVVAYFDAYKAIGVATEIIGVTEVGNQLIEQLKSGDF